jgi:hypothetical protein
MIIMPVSANNQQPSKAISTIVLAGFVAGTLDITAACTEYYLNTGKGPGNVLRYVASGVFGKKAFTGGVQMAAWGLLFHYIIALGLTIFFFWFFPKLKLLSKNIIVTGLLYGIFAWVITVLIIVPLSNTPPPAPFNIRKAAIAILILMFCIGLPIALIISRYYSKNKLTKNRV